MKHLLILLMHRTAKHPWWELRSSEGDPPSERVAHHILDALITVVRKKLSRIEDENEPIDPRP